MLPAGAPPPPSRSLPPRPSPRQDFALAPAGSLDLAKGGPEDERMARVFALSAELIGGSGGRG